jgi:hypothetical protein
MNWRMKKGTSPQRSFFSTLPASALCLEAKPRDRLTCQVPGIHGAPVINHPGRTGSTTVPDGRMFRRCIMLTCLPGASGTTDPVRTANEACHETAGTRSRV